MLGVKGVFCLGNPVHAYAEVSATAFSGLYVEVPFQQCFLVSSVHCCVLGLVALLAFCLPLLGAVVQQECGGSSPLLSCLTRVLFLPHSCGPCPEEESASLAMDISCFPAQELPSPGAAPTSGELRSQPVVPGPEPEGLAPLSDIPLEQSPAATGQEEASPSPALPEALHPSHPVSLSLYMLRLPPPAGAYIQNEHSYQVGSALLWKRRAEAALSALGKAQRQLQACRRREQRLRLRICELQRERQPHGGDTHRQLKEHLQVFELQLLSDLE